MRADRADTRTRPPGKAAQERTGDCTRHNVAAWSACRGTRRRRAFDPQGTDTSRRRRLDLARRPECTRPQARCIDRADRCPWPRKRDRKRRSSRGHWWCPRSHRRKRASCWGTRRHRPRTRLVHNSCRNHHSFEGPRRCQYIHRRRRVAWPVRRDRAEPARGRRRQRPRGWELELATGRTRTGPHKTGPN